MNEELRAMKSTTLLLLVIAFATTTFAQSGSTTLSSLNKYGGEKYQGPNRKYCLDFTAGASAERSDPCDLRYGSLYVGEDWDWFQSSADQNSRSVIKDLGALTWEEEIKVPVVTRFLRPVSSGSHPERGFSSRFLENNRTTIRK